MPALKSVLPGYATMKPNTALSILLAAISLWLATSEGADDRPSAAHRISALAAAAIAGLTLVEYAGGLDLHIDQLLFADSDPLSLPHPGRMSAPTALCLAMFGIAMSLPRRSEPSINAAFGALYALAIVICLLALVGFPLWRTGALPAPAQHVDRHPYGGDPAHPHDRRGGDAAGCRFLCARQFALHRRDDRPAPAAGGDCVAADPRLDRSSGA